MANKVKEIEISYATHCNRSFFCIKHEDDSFGFHREVNTIKEVAQHIRNSFNSVAEGYNISCNPEFEITVSHGKNPTYHKALTSEQEVELFQSMQYR